MDFRTPSAVITSLALAFVFQLLPLPASSVGVMSTLGPMWSKSNDSLWNAHTPFSNSFVLCVLESGTLIPSCAGNYPIEGNTSAPRVPMFALSSGGFFTCGLTYESKKPLCWGNSSGMVPLAYRDQSYISLSAGQGHVCALRTNGSLDCWGSNTYNQLDWPQFRRFAQVSSGYDYTCGLNENGIAFCWGWDRSSGQNYAPQPSNTVFSALYSGGTHTCALERTTGFAVCWGWDNYNQCRNPAGLGFSSLALGLFHSCGIVKGKGTVVCWGDNAFGQADPPKDEMFSVIAAGDYYNCGVSLNETNKVKCWGNSVAYSGTIKASQGLCTSQSCGGQQYQSGRCPAAGDKVCLDCTQDMQCLAATPVSGPSPHPETKKKGNAVGISVGISVGIVAVVLVAAIGGFLCWRRRRRPSREDKHETWKGLANRLVSFKSPELANATSNYHSDMIIGRGGSGVVYKAVLPDGRMLALKKSKVGDKTLARELSLLARVHHTNLVNLVGYCSQEQLLAFEFMENGSLFDCLFRRPEIKLDCFMRIRIATQAARGLEYLHIYASPWILHRDVKAANILLDNNWNAHLSDFGFSLATSGSNLQMMTLVGTPGYMDPDYFQAMQFTPQSDVYSFGVVLLELLTGRQAMISSNKSLVSWILPHLEIGNESSVLDPEISTLENAKALEMVLELALQCTRVNDNPRPDISYVANTLERALSMAIPEDNSSDYSANSLSISSR